MGPMRRTLSNQKSKAGVPPLGAMLEFPKLSDFCAQDSGPGKEAEDVSGLL